jgi:hypothetical protein
MTTPRSYSRHGLNAPMARVNLRGFHAIDRRTAAARETLAFKKDLAVALGGEADLSPQRRKLVDLAARAALLLDHVDAWLFEQRSLVNARARTLLPVLVQRQALADHLARLLDKLGLDRVPQKVPDLTAYLAAKYPGASPEPTDDTAARSAHTVRTPVKEA